MASIAVVNVNGNKYYSQPEQVAQVLKDLAKMPVKTPEQKQAELFFKGLDSVQKELMALGAYDEPGEAYWLKSGVQAMVVMEKVNY